MHTITFLIAVAALVIAILAYQRTGGSRKDLEKLLREKAAETLAKAEKSLRTEDKKEE
jgi:hypothetical protein